MTLPDLYQHQLFKEVVADSVAIHSSLGMKLTDEIDESRTLDELQFYVLRVGFSLSHAASWIEQLHHAVHFMTDFRYGKKASSAGVTRSHHLLYNIENYLIRMVSVYDRCLQLANAVFHLCISDEHVNHSAIVSNLHVSRTDVPKLLKAVRKPIKDQEQERHKLIHRHSQDDPELRRIQLLYMHTKETWGDDRKLPYEGLVHVRGQLVKKFTAQRTKEYAEINRELLSAIGPYLDGLLTEYRRQKARLEKLV
ncbi:MULTISPECIES: Cthe_2314 family HEPN domain-containing protein [unclassified Rhizobacter]|uniref:Cthe_2314 family HEPN domain-containing protein n=1 Tax=unclassified Rhizobacter TaxID=2640088 RepID=UPI000715202C|nr:MULTISPECIES: Cthe_2314 family HEPN domain-containing protein [unclassified Rhizobacter]KQW13886.1 hypothetical protein ASC98_17460 [Rhizobacter sp. Root1238]